MLTAKGDSSLLIVMKHLPLKLGIFVVLLFTAVIATCLLWTPVKMRYYASLMNTDEKEVKPAFDYLVKCGDAGLKIIEDFCRNKTDNSLKVDNQGKGIRIRLLPNKYLFRQTSELIQAYRNYRDYKAWRKFSVSALEQGDFLTVKVINNTGNEIHVHEKEGFFQPLFNHTQFEFYTKDGLKYFRFMDHPMGMPECTLIVKNGHSVSGKHLIWFVDEFVEKPGIYILEVGLEYCVDVPVSLRSNRICFAIIPKE